MNPKKLNVEKLFDNFNKIRKLDYIIHNICMGCGNDVDNSTNRVEFAITALCERCQGE